MRTAKELIDEMVINESNVETAFSSAEQTLSHFNKFVSSGESKQFTPEEAREFVDIKKKLEAVTSSLKGISKKFQARK
jgi:hypothetical protein